MGPRRTKMASRIKPPHARGTPEDDTISPTYPWPREEGKEISLTDPNIPDSSEERWDKRASRRYNPVLTINILPTRFVDARALNDLGLHEDLHVVFNMLGIAHLCHITHPLYPDLTTSSGPLSLVISPAPTADPVNAESSREELAQESSGRGIAEPSVSDGNKKKRSAPGSSASVEARTGSESDEPPKKRKKREKKKKMTVGERLEPSGDVGGQELVAFDNSNRDAAAQTSVELDESPNVPLE
ncbi:hypothetical protein F2Q68_00031693 [Brassica cretica]|uniref:Uncharacterized protein n=1 Tax=Brassica cretica TaxID=69181 RepID=A0A8S9G9N9_BRACR|nr:hypothetical protein F2Q68_00031693 [Brassica cretica]